MMGKKRGLQANYERFLRLRIATVATAAIARAVPARFHHFFFLASSRVGRSFFMIAHFLQKGSQGYADDSAQNTSPNFNPSQVIRGDLQYHRFYIAGRKSVQFIFYG